MVALYITSLQVGAGKTTVCAGIGNHLLGEGRKVGFFKPIVAGIKSLPMKAIDGDAVFMKQVLVLEEPVDSLCPVIDEKGNLTDKIKEAYARVSAGKDVVIIEGIWRQSPGGKSIEAPYKIVETLNAGVIIVAGYSQELFGAKFIDKCRDFGEYLLGVVLNKMPGNPADHVYNQLSAKFGEAGIDVLGMLSEDRVLSAFTIGELAEYIQGEILNCAENSAELVENLMLGAMTVEPGPDYFGRKDNKVVVVRGERPDMQLAALETSTKCLVLSDEVAPINTVLQRAENKGIPIILAKGDTLATVMNVEQALVKTRFNQEKKLTRLAEIMEQQFNFQAVNKGLGLTN